MGASRRSLKDGGTKGLQMASTAVTPETRVINPLRKAAIFLIALGDQASAGIMRHLSKKKCER